MPDVGPADVDGLLAGYASQRRSAVDVVESSVARLGALDPELHCVTQLLRTTALAAAVESDRRWRAGTARPLEGIPFGVKDVIDVAGTATRAGLAAGSSPRVDELRAGDAYVVAQLRAAGAIPVAKLSTTALAFGDPMTPGLEPARHPGDLRRSPGTSSTGPAAAVAAGAVPFALGTDSGGSVRIPASHCGVVGMKPTYGSLSLAGVTPGIWSLDHVGVIARSVASVDRVLSVLGERRPATVGVEHDDGAGGRAGVRRVGVLRGPFTELCTPPQLASYEDALTRAASLDGIELTEVTPADLDIAAVITYVIAATELACSVEPVLPGADLGDALAAFVDVGSRMPVADYLRALRLRPLLARRMRAAFAGVDAVLAPTTQCIAPVLADPLVVTTALGDRPWFDVVAINTMLFNLLGWPALSVPALPAEDGLPFGLQIVAAAGADRVALDLAAALETVPTDRLVVAQ